MKSVGKYLLALLFAILLVYAFGAYFYSSHFPHNTIINGVNIGGMNPKDASVAVADHAHEYRLRIVGLSGEDTISGDDIDLKLDLSNEINEVFHEANPFAWPKNLFEERKEFVMGKVSFDEKKLKAQIDILSCFENMEKPKDAYIQLQDDTYVIREEQRGSFVSKKELGNRINRFIHQLNDTLDIYEEGLYREAKVKKDDKALVAACKKANLYAKAKIKYLPDTETLDFSTTRDWIILNEENKITIDKDMVKKYVEGLAERYNSDQLAFTRHDGQTQYYNGDEFQVEINQEEEAKAIVNNIKAGQEVSREPILLKSGVKIGKTYVEVSLHDNHAWLYQNGYVLSEGDITVGPISDGIYFVKQKDSEKITFDASHSFVLQTAQPTTPSETEVLDDIAYMDQQEENSGNISCVEDFFKNLQSTCKEGTPVIIY